MLRRLASLGVVTLGLMCMAIKPRDAAPQPPPAPVPTGKKVITTAPPTPPPAPPSAKPSTAPSAAPSPAPNSVEKARQGVVSVERAGKALALGVVLAGDGRVLTALSALGNGNFLNVRYADGALVPLKLTLSDRGWDLALLTPQATPAQPLRKAGLSAARTPSFVGLQSLNLAAQNKVAAAPAELRLSAGLLGGDATPLGGAYELGSVPAFVGGPIVNPEGEVVALVARACPLPTPQATPAPTPPACVPKPYGAPVSALKQFLQRVPAEATWLGVEVIGDETRGVHGLRVISVIPNSPAAIGGLRPGVDAGAADLVVAVDGTPVSTPNELNEAVRARTTGDSVELLLFGLGRYRQISVKPRPAPQLTTPPIFMPRPGNPRTPNPYR
jgi:serine protease Do